MKNKKFMMAILIIIFVVGMVSVFAMGKHYKSWYGHEDWEKSGEHTYKTFEDKSVWLEKMGLPSDATEAQMIEAKKSLWGQKEDYMVAMKEKFGLHEDASAWQEMKSFHKGSGFHKESWCGKS